MDRSEQIVAEKKSLRALMFERRKQLDPAWKTQYDKTICQQLADLIATNNYQVVHAYIPMANEIDISPLLQNLLDQGIQVICPKTLPKRKLENRILHSLSQLETGIMGTQHPVQDNLFEGDIDLIIVPGLACDANNYRLGYGGGYYDNFLVNHPNAKKVGIFYPFQEIKAVPREAHDQCLDKLLII